MLNVSSCPLHGTGPLYRRLHPDILRISERLEGGGATVFRDVSVSGGPLVHCFAPLSMHDGGLRLMSRAGETNRDNTYGEIQTRYYIETRTVGK